MTIHTLKRTDWGQVSSLTLLAILGAIFGGTGLAHGSLFLISGSLIAIAYIPFHIFIFVPWWEAWVDRWAAKKRAEIDQQYAELTKQWKARQE